MSLHLTVRDALYFFPGIEDCPNISSTGSLRGMRSKFGWDLNYVVRAGKWYYYLREYPRAAEIVKQLKERGYK